MIYQCRENPPIHSRPLGVEAEGYHVTDQLNQWFTLRFWLSHDLDLTNAGKTRWNLWVLREYWEPYETDAGLSECEGCQPDLVILLEAALRKQWTNGCVFNGFVPVDHSPHDFGMERRLALRPAFEKFQLPFVR